MCHSVPVLRVEEWPLPGESLSVDFVGALIDRVSDIYCQTSNAKCAFEILFWSGGFIPLGQGCPNFFQRVPDLMR